MILEDCYSRPRSRTCSRSYSPPPKLFIPPEARQSSAAVPQSLIEPMQRTQAFVNTNIYRERAHGGIRAQASKALEGAVSATFTIPGLSSIPSDSDRSQQTHKVSISELEFSSVDFEWVAVPKKIASAFLKVGEFLKGRLIVPSGLMRLYPLSARSRTPQSMYSFPEKQVSS